MKHRQSNTAISHVLLILLSPTTTTNPTTTTTTINTTVLYNSMHIYCLCVLCVQKIDKQTYKTNNYRVPLLLIWSVLHWFLSHSDGDNNNNKQVIITRERCKPSLIIINK